MELLAKVVTGILALSLWFGIRISQLVYGVRSHLRVEPVEYFLPQQDTIYVYNMAITIFIIALMPLIGRIFLSCKGEEAGMVKTWMSFLNAFVFMLILTLELTSGILAVTMRNTLIRESQNEYPALNHTWQKTLTSQKAADIEAWNEMQSALKCCGLENGLRDWTAVQDDIPSSCCEGSQSPCEMADAYQEHCDVKVHELLKNLVIPTLKTAGTLNLVPATIGMISLFVVFVLATAVWYPARRDVQGVPDQRPSERPNIFQGGQKTKAGGVESATA